MTSSADISFNRTQISNEASQKRVYCPYIKSLILSALLNEFAWEQNYIMLAFLCSKNASFSIPV